MPTLAMKAMEAVDLNLNKIISILKSIGPSSIREIQQEYSKIHGEELTTREVI